MGVQEGRIALKERQLRGTKPRVRKKRLRADESGEVEIPAYTAMQADQGLADLMLELVMNGVSTAAMRRWLPALADQWDQQVEGLARRHRFSTIGGIPSRAFRRWPTVSSVELSRVPEWYRAQFFGQVSLCGASE